MTLRVGISGYGLAGRYFHAPVLKAAGFEIAGVLTRNAERRAHALADFPETTVVSSIQELLGLDLDLLVVASANIAHAEEAIAGLRAGVPVVVDKPMGRNLEETEEIVAVSAETGVVVSTYFNRLFDSDALTVKKALAEGVLGNVFRLDSRFERFRPTSNPNSWREASSASDGGGNLLDLGPHLVSLALDWFGPAEVTYASVLQSLERMVHEFAYREPMGRWSSRIWIRKSRACEAVNILLGESGLHLQLLLHLFIKEIRSLNIPPNQVTTHSFILTLQMQYMATVLGQLQQKMP
eukprot:gene977-985_t